MGGKLYIGYRIYNSYMATPKNSPGTTDVPQKEKMSTIAISQTGKDRLHTYGMGGDTDEQIINRVLNELSAYRIRDGKPAAGVLDQDVRK